LHYSTKKTKIFALRETGVPHFSLKDLVLRLGLGCACLGG